MDKMSVSGGQKLQGEVSVSGAKNSGLPILFSSLLAEGEHVFYNVPKLVDIHSTSQLLESLGCSVVHDGSCLRVKVGKLENPIAAYDIVRKMRASILCLGPLLARCHQAEVSMPGGCAIGTRPINLHLEALKEMGANIQVEKGYVHGSCSGLKAARILFDSPTVGGTENIMMAATLAEGETVLENAAKEPEIVDLANYLIAMGAKILGAGTGIIKITGVNKLTPAEHNVIPDRIEAGTLVVATAITGGEVLVKNCNPLDFEALIIKMKECGIQFQVENDSILVKENSGFECKDITTAPHPGFPTDLQAQYMALMTQGEGTSLITESVFENRFMHVQELVRLGADITPKTRVAVVRGKRGCLHGAPVMATDLRASACLVLAGLVAKGETLVQRIYHLDRGYEALEVKLQSVGAKISRTSS